MSVAADKGLLLQAAGLSGEPVDRAGFEQWAVGLFRNSDDDVCKGVLGLLQEGLDLSEADLLLVTNEV